MTAQLEVRRPTSAVRIPGTRISVRWRLRPVVVTVTAAVTTFALFCVSLGTGDLAISLPDVLATLFGRGDTMHAFVIHDLRLPRAVLGVLVGLALGVSGAIVQTIARNPLASPDVLGVTAGAGAAAVAVVTGVGGHTISTLSALGLPLAAMIGGLLTGIFVLAVSALSKGGNQRLVLVGVAVTAIMSALTQWMLVKADIRDVGQAQLWLVGALEPRQWSQVWMTLWGIGGLTILAIALAFPLRAIALGEDVAVMLGVRLTVVRLSLLLTAVLLTGIAVAAAGPVFAVALIAPQVTVRLSRLASPPLLASGIMGALLLTAADLCSRTMFADPLPVGVVTAAIGGPFLVLVILRANLATAFGRAPLRRWWKSRK
ncbi:FecCD family ABC transporter permease [Nocardia sp. NPDC050175]|uniref:FecCD family ABC transporter permease n=1 Tax=Nocardia sp. NPDC050175 TaxID=3364317 RepID=UPI0037942895